ncbi:MAG: hypothetical protein IJM76_04955 [Lachnospiraceae bacterium]|nr:hypothetical protein [Lachnospiraceae bacterium]
MKKVLLKGKLQMHFFYKKTFVIMLCLLLFLCTGCGNAVEPSYDPSSSQTNAKTPTGHPGLPGPMIYYQGSSYIYDANGFDLTLITGDQMQDYVYIGQVVSSDDYKLLKEDLASGWLSDINKKVGDKVYYSKSRNNLIVEGEDGLQARLQFYDTGVPH